MHVVVDDVAGDAVVDGVDYIVVSYMPLLMVPVVLIRFAKLTIILIAVQIGCSPTMTCQSASVLPHRTLYRVHICKLTRKMNKQRIIRLRIPNQPLHRP